ncbi:MAG: universal stress protein [Saprospiraceae bacterium]|nr:universal stress protein [Saprospiraceae bacterium]
MKKILVPIDFSPNSKNALWVAAEIAAKSGARLELLHVNVATIYSTPPEYARAVAHVEDPEYDDSAISALEKLSLELSENPVFAKLKIDMRVEDGFLHTSIREVSEVDTVDLVVMGTKGASGLKEFLIGSNTEKVIRTAPCPVLVVPEGVERLDVKTVLLPSTLKDDQQGIFRYLAKWQKIFGFTVKVLYLNNPAGFPTDGSAEAMKNRLAEAAGLEKPDVVMTMSAFFEDSTILSAAEHYDADMIAMATHQRQGLSHVLFGSVTEDTINHSKLPVLAVPVRWTES